MAIEWTPKLAVGVDLIDGQHQELFRRVNALLAAMASHEGRGELAGVVAFLREYVVKHFGDEARLMQNARYPELAFHLAEHAQFVEEFKVLAGALAKDGPTTQITIRLSALLCDWLRRHVSTADRELGRFLAARSAA
jgi:hemerythrin